MEPKDPRVEDGVRHHKIIYGEKPPTSPEEINSDNPGTPSDHPYDSIMEDADIGAASYLFSDDSSSDPKGERVEEEYGPHVNRNLVDDPKSIEAVEEITGEENDPLEPEEDVMTDGGYNQTMKDVDHGEEYDESQRIFERNSETPWEKYGIIP